MIELVIDPRRRNIGSLEVGRVLPFGMRRMVGPFIFFDHMGPVDLPRGLPREADVLPHPQTVIVPRRDTGRSVPAGRHERSC